MKPKSSEKAIKNREKEFEFITLNIFVKVLRKAKYVYSL